MKASDLMIGDWVMYNPNVFIEDEYELPKEWFPTQINSGEDIDLAIEGCYDSIPLTPEILDKIGFVKYIAGQYVLPKMVGEIIVCITPMEGLPNADNKWLVAIKNGYTDVKIPITYIHELQHVLKLCKIEKDIII